MSWKNLHEHPAIQKLQSAMRREQRLKLLASFGLLALGLVFCSLAFEANILLAIFGLVLTVLGIRFVYLLLFSGRTEAGRLMHLLEHQPKQIVWVYSVVTERLPFGLQFSRNSTLYFKLMDRDEITVSLPARDLKPVARALNKFLPHASFGYTEDREQWYLASPAMLLQDEGSNGKSRGIT